MKKVILSLFILLIAGNVNAQVDPWQDIFDQQYYDDSLEFLNAQRIGSREMEGKGFDNLYQSFKPDPDNPDDSYFLAHFGRVWVYDIALGIYADLKTGNIEGAKKAINTMVNLAENEKALGFNGLWHFSYNTLDDDFIDPRGPLGAVLWMIKSIYAYIIQTGDTTHLDWVNEKMKTFIFDQQVTDRSDARYGLVRAGLQNTDDLNGRYGPMGYNVYKGNPNDQVEFCSIEHLADLIDALRLAYRATKAFGNDPRFFNDLKERHRIAIEATDKLWVDDEESGHYVTAMNADGSLNTSVAVDNNTWIPNSIMYFDEDRAWRCIQYIQERFLVSHNGFKGLFFFTSDFEDEYIKDLPDSVKVLLEDMIQPEATFGYIHFLKTFYQLTSDSLRRSEIVTLADTLYQNMVRFKNWATEGTGTPYASRRIEGLFTTLESMASSATGLIVSAEMSGINDDDFIGVVPPDDFFQPEVDPLIDNIQVTTSPNDDLNPSTAAWDSSVFVAWQNSNNIFVKSSNNFGATLGDSVHVGSGEYPAVAVDGNGSVYIVWGYGIINFSKSTDGGHNFSVPERLSIGYYPDITVDNNGYLYVVWQEDVGGYNYTAIYLAKSTNQGEEWDIVEVGQTTSSYFDPPKVAVSPSGTNVYVVWKCPPAFNSHVRVYMAVSHDGGAIFGDRFNPTWFVRHGEYDPDVATYREDDVYIVWRLDQYGDNDLYFTKSTDGGETFSSDARRVITTSVTSSQSLAVGSNGNIYVVWSDGDIYLSESTCGGNSFQDSIRIDNATNSNQNAPSIAVSNSAFVGIAWEDNRNGNYEIYYETFFIQPWDVNNDGVIDIADFALVGSHFGETGEGILGDVNKDGVVDIVDLMLVGSHFGE